MVDFAMVRKTYMYSPTLLARTKRYLLDMARRKKQNKKEHIGKKLIYLAIILLAGCIIGFEAYRMITSYMIEKSSDNKWPTHDLTSGQYSGSYDGIDISRHQGRIHWEELSNVKRLKFIYVKATEGTSIKDPWYEENIKNARKHQISVGSYHFLTKMPAVLQFENFRVVYDKEKQNLLPVVDAEDDGTKGLSKSEIQSLLKTFCKLCKSYYGHTPIIYCSESYFKDYLSPEFDDYYLWIASYNHEPVLPGKPHYDIWQYSRHGRVPGVWNWVDLNRFAKNRSIDDIRIN